MGVQRFHYNFQFYVSRRACVVLKLLLEGHGCGSFGAAEPCRCVWVAVSARCPPRWSHRCCMVLKLLSMVLYERDALLALSLEVPVALSKVCACCAGWRVVGAFVRRLAQCRVQGPNAFICLIIFILSASSAYSSSFHLQLRRRQHWQMLESRATARRREENVFGVLDLWAG